MAKRASLYMALAVWCGMVPGCVSDEGGTEIPNELIGHEIIAGKGAAANADLRLVPVGFVPGSTKDPGNTVAFLFAGKTDSKGRFAFKGVPAGTYNLMASGEGLQSFRDSLTITGLAQDLSQDTLRPASTLSGRVQLAPQDDPRKVIIHVLGTTQFVNVGQDGRFILRDLGAGQYRLRASVTNNSLYTDEYVHFTIGSGRDDSLPAPIVPYFDGIPSVQGLTAVPGPGGTVILNWKRPNSNRITAYMIYRDAEESALPVTVPLVRVKRTDTTYIDTVYKRYPETPYNYVRKPGEKDFFDTRPNALSYHVNMLDNTGAIGPTSEIVEVTALPPTVFTSGKWSQQGSSFPRSTAEQPWHFPRTHIVLSLRDSLWTLQASDSGGFGGANLAYDRAPIVHTSVDGRSWYAMKQQDTLDFAIMNATVWRDSIWIIGYHKDTHGVGDSLFWPSAAMSIWNSKDGSHWRQVAASLSIEYRGGLGFFPNGDSLWVVSSAFAVDNPDPMPAWHSRDGRSWVKSEATQISRGTPTATVVFQNRIYTIGGQANFRKIYSSQDGISWDSVAPPQGMLPRWMNTLTVHGGKLWLVGGYVFPDDPATSHRNDVWSSANGVDWTLVDGSAPFPGRSLHSAVSFKGKLWIFGGQGKAGQLTDVWAMEP